MLRTSNIIDPKPQLWLSTQAKPIIIFASKTRVLAKIDHYHHGKFREAIEIGKHPNNLNRDDGWKISDNWIPTLTGDSTVS